MRLARELGVSPRRLDGWEPAEVTTFEYDDAGRVVRAVTVREAEFSPADRETLLESRRFDMAPRGRHGLLVSETTDPKHEHDWEVGLPVLDFAQAKLDAAKSAYRKTYPEANMDSLLFRVQRRATGE